MSRILVVLTLALLQLALHENQAVAVGNQTVESKNETLTVKSENDTAHKKSNIHKHSMHNLSYAFHELADHESVKAAANESVELKTEVPHSDPTVHATAKSDSSKLDDVVEAKLKNVTELLQTKKFNILEEVANKLSHNDGKTEVISMPGTINLYGNPPKRDNPALPEPAEPFRVVATPHLDKFHSIPSSAPQPVNEQMFAESNRPQPHPDIQNSFFRPPAALFGGEGGVRKPLLSMRAIDTPNPPLNVQNMEQMRSVGMGTGVGMAINEENMDRGSLMTPIGPAANFERPLSLQEENPDGNPVAAFGESPLGSLETSPRMMMQRPQMLPNVGDQDPEPFPQNKFFTGKPIEPELEDPVGLKARSGDLGNPMFKIHDIAELPAVIGEPKHIYHNHYRTIHHHHHRRHHLSNRRDKAGKPRSLNIVSGGLVNLNKNYRAIPAIIGPPRHVYHTHYRTVHHAHRHPIVPLPRARCFPNPCRNGGTCTATEHGYTCGCSIGNKGIHCEEINSCQPNPCKNGAECYETGDGFKCNCDFAHKGEYCEIVDHCKPNPCNTGGTCVEVDDGFHCACSAGYMGPRCEALNFCSVNPCQNGGSCLNLEDKFECVCQPNSHGPRCEELDHCHSSPCHNGGSCHNQLNQFTCTCPERYSGPMCTEHESPCDPNPCQNDGKCTETDFGFKCQCAPGHHGETCDTVNHCFVNPCLNSGACIETPHGFQCVCNHNYFGDTCEHSKNSCSGCDANAECIKGQCVCLPDFTGNGKVCEAASKCHPNPCLNGGSCRDREIGFECACSGGYEGAKCEEMNPCYFSPCRNDGRCNYIGNGEYKCECTSAYIGANCDEPNPCIPNPCRYGGLCHLIDKMAKCGCTERYRGDFCEVDRCDTCDRNAFCDNDGDCHCAAGFYGSGLHGDCHMHVVPVPTTTTTTTTTTPRPPPLPPTTQPKVPTEPLRTPPKKAAECGEQDCGAVVEAKPLPDEPPACVSNPCINGGTCIDEPGGRFKCICRMGFEGKFCENKEKIPNANPCIPNPCNHGGTCIDEDNNAFICKCPPGFFGKFCNHEGSPIDNPGEKIGVDKDHKGKVTGAKSGHINEKKGDTSRGGPLHEYVSDGPVASPCHPNPCQNSGTCHEFDNGRNYKCICPVGYDGSHCQEDICSECNVHALCIAGKCRCRHGYKGDGYECFKIQCDDCDPHASCHQGECVCDPGWSGSGKHCTHNGPDVPVPPGHFDRRLCPTLCSHQCHESCPVACCMSYPVPLVMGNPGPSETPPPIHVLKEIKEKIAKEVKEPPAAPPSPPPSPKAPKLIVKAEGGGDSYQVNPSAPAAPAASAAPPPSAPKAPKLIVKSEGGGDSYPVSAPPPPPPPPPKMAKPGGGGDPYITAGPPEYLQACFGECHKNAGSRGDTVSHVNGPPAFLADCFKKCDEGDSGVKGVTTTSNGCFGECATACLPSCPPNCCKKNKVAGKIADAKNEGGKMPVTDLENGVLSIRDMCPPICMEHCLAFCPDMCCKSSGGPTILKQPPAKLITHALVVHDNDKITQNAEKKHSMTPKTPVLQPDTVPVQRSKTPVRPVQRSKTPARPVQRSNTPVPQVRRPVQRSKTPVPQPQPAQRSKTPVPRPRPVQRSKTPVPQPRKPVQRSRAPLPQPRPPIQRSKTPVPRPRPVPRSKTPVQRPRPVTRSNTPYPQPRRPVQRSRAPLPRPKAPVTKKFSLPGERRVYAPVPPHRFTSRYTSENNIRDALERRRSPQQHCGALCFANCSADCPIDCCSVKRSFIPRSPRRKHEYF